MTKVDAQTGEPASPWAWALFLASSLFALAAAALLGFWPGG
jgi:hypothetical protein